MVISEIHDPKDMTELLEAMRRHPEALLYAGGTDILREQGGRAIELPAVVIAVYGVPELRRIDLTERYLELGAAVTLSEALELGETALPPILADTIRGIGTPALRNLATLGGNLACKSRFMDTWPTLACLDALAEFRDAGGSSWINVNRLVGEDGSPSIPEGKVVTRVRIPLEHWDVSVVRKVGQRDYPAPETAVFSFAARAEKSMLVDFRLAFAGEKSLRLQDIEGRILGRGLPLSERERASFVEEYREAAAVLPEGLALRFGVLVDGALDLLAR